MYFLAVARLGNLIMIPTKLNHDLSTKPFEVKQELLRAAAEEGLYVDPFVLNATKWTEEEIDNRTRMLAEIAYNEVWSLNGVRP